MLENISQGFQINAVFMVYVVGAILCLLAIAILLWIRFKPEFWIAYLEQPEHGKLLTFNPQKETPDYIYADNGYKFRKTAPKYQIIRGALKRITLVLARKGRAFTCKTEAPEKKLSLYDYLKDVLGMAKDDKGKATEQYQIDLMEPEQLDLVKKAELLFTVEFDDTEYDIDLPEFTDFDEPNEQMALLIGRSIKKALQTSYRDIIRDLALMGAGVTVWNLLKELGLM